jgi:hypothetical protein
MISLINSANCWLDFNPNRWRESFERYALEWADTTAFSKAYPIRLFSIQMQPAIIH